MEPRYRILLADDVVRYHKLYELAITDALPAKVHFAENGEEALEKLASPIPYDLLVLDLNMPKLGGEATLARLRQNPNYDHLPVVILTGDTDEETHRRLLDAGADDFVEKGAPPEVFIARLKAQMRHKLTLERLARLAVDMDIFAAGVLHDIRNLETHVLAVCELARSYLDEDPRGRRELMIQDLLSLEQRADDLGRYAAEIIRMVRETHQPLDPKPLALGPLLEWAVQLATPRAGDDLGVRLACQVVGTLAPVVADRHFLQLALLNIAQNALKYRRPGAAPELVVSQRPAAGAVARTVVTCLRDHGVGIKRQDLRRVFEPFARGGGAKPGGGYGLGLALVQKVMGAMGGRVWAELPESGPGTILCLELPAAEAPA